VDTELLILLSSHYPRIEWGILFRQDLAGLPRYPSWEWVLKLTKLSAISVETETNSTLNLAAHLCNERCQEVLDGNSNFVVYQLLYSLVNLNLWIIFLFFYCKLTLFERGFRRFQINATLANGVVLSKDSLATAVHNLLNIFQSFPQAEWIIQANEETKLLYELILLQDPFPENVSILFDASCGRGILVDTFPSPYPNVKCGYAGGIGPTNITSVLHAINMVATGKDLWIDMESSLRSKLLEGDIINDVFDVSKCFSCILSTEKFLSEISNKLL